MMDAMKVTSLWESECFTEHSLLYPNLFKEELPNGTQNVQDQLNDYLVESHGGFQMEEGWNKKATTELEGFSDDILQDWMDLKTDFQLDDGLEDLLESPALVLEDLKEKTLDFLPSSPALSSPYSNMSSPAGLVPQISPPCSPLIDTSFLYTSPPLEKLEKSNQNKMQFFSDHLDPHLESSGPLTFDLNEPITFYIQIPEMEIQQEIPMIVSKAEIKIEKPVVHLTNSLAPVKVLETKRGPVKASKTSLNKPLKKTKAPGARKERKRLQNKDAATRYRQKKRAESDAASEIENNLLEVNKGLKESLGKLTSEITYLKGLMREMFKARGLMK